MHKHILPRLIIALVISSLLTILPTNLGSIQPSTPTFTIEDISTSYDIPSTSEKDPYTGETTTKPGYTIENKNIYIKIKNQPFTPVTKDNGTYTKLYYKYRYKGHFSDNNKWITPTYIDPSFEQTTNTEHTLIYLPLSRPYGDPPKDGDKFDVQVQAIIYSRTAFEVTWGRPHIEYSDEQIESPWSSTQTVTYKSPVKSTTSPPSNTAPITTDPSAPNPSNAETIVFGLALWKSITLGVLFSVIVVLLVIVVVYLRGRSNAVFSRSLGRYADVIFLLKSLLAV